MTTREDIDRQINNDWNNFYKKIYDGPVPNDALEHIRVALKIMPPAQFQASPAVLKQLIAKRHDEISFLDMGIIVNTMINIPLDVNFDSLEEGLDYLEEFYDIKDEYNQKVEKMRQSCERKRNKLYELSGLTGGSIQMPGTANNHKKR